MGGMSVVCGKRWVEFSVCRTGMNRIRSLQYGFCVRLPDLKHKKTPRTALLRYGGCGFAPVWLSGRSVVSGKDPAGAQGFVADGTGAFLRLSALCPVGLPVQFRWFYFWRLSDLASALSALLFLPGMVQSVVADAVLPGFRKVPEPALDEVMGFESLGFRLLIAMVGVSIEHGVFVHFQNRLIA